MILPEYLPAQRDLAKVAAGLALLSMLLGLSLAFADDLDLARAELLAAHQNALMGTFWLIAVAWSLPMLQYGPAGQGRLAWALILGTVANALLPIGRAWFDVEGRRFTGDNVNDAFLIALNLTVTLPCLAGTLGWVFGFRKPR